MTIYNLDLFLSQFVTSLLFHVQFLPATVNLPTVVGIRIIWIKFAHSCPFLGHWFLKCQCSLEISCLATPNLPWFTDLIVQVSMQYFSLQHQTLPSPPVTSTTGRCFHFGSISSFHLELFLCSSLAAYWTPSTLCCVCLIAHLCLTLWLHGL